MEHNILNNISSINLIITHTHSDHIGSLGSLITYFYYSLNKKIKIIIPNCFKFKYSIKNILNSFGCTKNMYTFVNEKVFDNKYDSFSNIRYIPTIHSNNLKCFSIIFNTKKGLVYYSGDTKETNTLTKIIKSNKVIDKLYVDTTDDELSSNVHININELIKVIPEEHKNKVYCMHINRDSCIDKIIDNGFNIVKVL